MVGLFANDVKADVALYNTGGIRAEISAGDLTVGDVYAVYPFDNVLSVATLSGKDLKTLFDYVASSGGLPINKEVKMVISGKKVKSVTVNGETIKDNQTYTVATINYLMNLGRYGLENATGRRKKCPDYQKSTAGSRYTYPACQTECPESTG